MAVIFLIGGWWGRIHSIVSGGFLGLVVLGSIRKRVEEATGSKAVSALLHVLCISFCLQVPTLLEFPAFDNKQGVKTTLSSSSCFGHGDHHSNSSDPRTGMRVPNASSWMLLVWLSVLNL